MVMQPQLLNILACPRCKGTVAEDRGGTGLVCDTCRLVYPIRDQIPILLIGEAQPLP